MRQCSGASCATIALAWEHFPELVRDNPETYAAALRKLAELDPELFPTLAEYLARHHQDEQAAQAYLEIVQRRMGGQAYHDGMDWLADYYMDRSRPDEALAVGRLAEASGSPAGLRTMARVQERLANPARAEALYERVEEVFDDPSPLTGFYARQATPESELEAARRRGAGLPSEASPSRPIWRKSTPPVRGVALRQASAGGSAAGFSRMTWWWRSMAARPARSRNSPTCAASARPPRCTCWSTAKASTANCRSPPTPPRRSRISRHTTGRGTGGCCRGPELFCDKMEGCWQWKDCLAGGRSGGTCWALSEFGTGW